MILSAIADCFGAFVYCWLADYYILITVAKINQPPLIGGIIATVSPDLSCNTAPAETYSSLTARVINSSSSTRGASLGNRSASFLLIERIETLQEETSPW